MEKKRQESKNKTVVNKLLETGKRKPSKAAELAAKEAFLKFAFKKRKRDGKPEKKKIVPLSSKKISEFYKRNS